MNDSALRRLLPGFAAVGALGFAVDAGILYLLVRSGYGPVVSRFVSASCAITVTWLLNRRYVFRTSDANSSMPEYFRYAGVQVLGFVVNFSVYLSLIGTVDYFHDHPVLALCWGALASLALTFLGARYFAFRTD